LGIFKTTTFKDSTLKADVMYVPIRVHALVSVGRGFVVVPGD